MILLVLAAAAAQPAETPRQFLARVYAQYRHSNFSPLERPERYFSPALTAAIREDSRLAKGEVGALDGDPLCDCQDYGRLSANIRSLQQSGPTATARVLVTLGPKDTRNLRLSLVQTRSGWRVNDVIDPYGRSLLKVLRRSNSKH
ncbi:MAG TPA: DUF3828 domain-containing protein [Sphingomicrobium sp.]